jgi:hypothetical protein
VNGGGDLAGLSNLSSRVALETINTSYDRQANRLTFKTVLHNTSKTDTIRGPLKARVLVLTSENASKVEIANPDNQVRGVGAVWDFTSQLKNGMLLPDSMSTPKELVFQLTGLSRFREGTELRLGFVNMDAKILGPAVRPRGGARAAPYWQATASRAINPLSLAGQRVALLVSLSTRHTFVMPQNITTATTVAILDVRRLHGR